MKQKTLIGSMIGLVGVCIYIWYTFFTIVDEKMLKELLPFLSTEADAVDKTDEHGWTPLMQASWDGDLEKARSLINDGANVNITDEDETTPLHLAAHEGHFEIVKLLMESGAFDSLNKHTEDDNETPLYVAAENGHIEIFNFLIEKGAILDPELRNKMDGYTMLHAAVRTGKFDMVKHLLDLGFDPNARDEDDQTPIMLIFGIIDTTPEDLIKMITILVNGGAEVNVKDIKGVSPLFMAYYEGKEEVIDYLIQLGAKGVIQTKAQAEEALELLEINSVEEYRREISFGNTGVVKLFLMAGYDPNVRDIYGGSTMLFQLVFPEELEMMNLLMSYGADPNIKTNNDGITPLWIAVSQNKPKVVELLLKYGAKNIVNDAGWTPLMVAEDDGNVEIINLLNEYLNENNGTVTSFVEEDTTEDIGTDFYDDGDSSKIEEIPEFAVYQNNEIIARFYTESEAIAFAINYENVEVWVPNSTIWDNKPSRVYQNDELIGEFATKVEALKVAGSLENAKVVNVLTGKVEWDSYPRECRTCESAIEDQY